jgi:sortase A
MARRSPIDIDDPLGRLGIIVTALGTLAVTFACYQMWGTGVLEWQAQRHLDAELAAKLDGPTSSPSTPSPWESRVPAHDLVPVAADLVSPPSLAAADQDPDPAPPDPPPAHGEVLGRIEIPSIGVSKVISQGVDRDTLRQGPGHYPSSALPGDGGNVAIAGHRTTHGAPFFDLDQVAPGDLIEIETVDGVFSYEVEAHRAPDGSERGHRIVDPSAVEVIADQGDDRLTLTACHPQYSARQRIIVSALLIESDLDPEPPINEPDLDPAPSPQGAGPGPPQLGGSGPVEPADPVATTGGTGPGPAGDDSLGWQPEQVDPTVMWATVLALVAHGGWIAGRLWRPRPAYLATTPVAAVPLFLFFVHLDRMLPAL